MTYTFTKDGDTWTYDGDTSLDMDEEAIDSMLATLSSLTAIEEISDYTDLKEFGFDQPEDLISYPTVSYTHLYPPCYKTAEKYFPVKPERKKVRSF